MSNRSIYLGYGVHAEHDPRINQILLYVDRAEGRHIVAMTQEEINSLVAFAKELPPLTGFAADGPTLVSA